MTLWILILASAVVFVLLILRRIAWRAPRPRPPSNDPPGDTPDHIVYPRRSFQPLGPSEPRPAPPREDPLASLREAGFEAVADRIGAGATSSLRLVATPSTELPPGATKLGGAPDLPPQLEWPHHEGRPLEFLAQVNLADVTRALPDADLPGEGWLLFFAKWDPEYVPWGEPEQAGEWRVLRVAGDEPVERRQPSPAEPSVRQSPCHRVELVPESTYRWIDFEEVGNDDAAQDALIDWQAEWERRWNPTLHRLLGEPQLIQSRSSLLHQLRGARPDVPPEDWRLLLQLDSVREDRHGPDDWMWGDGGRLYFMIRRDHLAAARFDDTWLVMQCM